MTATLEPSDPSISAGSEDQDVMGAARQRWAERLSFRNMSAVYIGIALFILFSLWVPDTFLQLSTWRQLIDSMAVTALLAMGLVFPVAAGQLDLSIGTQLGLGAIVVAKLISTGTSIPIAIAVTLLLGCVVGVVTSTLINEFAINSVIASLGVSSILLAAVSWLSADQQILGLGEDFQQLALTKIAGLTSETWIMLIAGLVLWYILEQTEFGRKIYATGGNLEAARLAGVRTSRIIMGSLVIGGLVAALAGVVSSARLATGDPTIGPPYLLPAFTAVFLGSTQFRYGRFNVPGTLVAGLVLALGVKGFQLAGAPVWIPDLFNGVSLLAAVGIAASESSHARMLMHRGLARLRRPRDP